MKLRTRILGLATALLAFLGVALGFSLALQEQSVREIRALATYHVPITAAVAETDVLAYEYQLVMERLLRETAPAADVVAAAAARERAVIAALNRELAALRSLLGRAMDDPRNPIGDRLAFAGLEASVRRVQREAEAFEAVGRAILAAAAAGDWTGARGRAAEFARFEQVFGEDLGEVRAHVIERTAASTAATALHQERLRHGSFLLFLVAAGFGLGVAGWVANRAVTALQRLLERVRRVEEGDLDTTLVVRGTDEVARLTDAFNRMIEELRAKRRIQDTFGRYVDPRIVRSLVQPDGSEPPPERRVVTAFFSDIAGFTRLSERMTAGVVTRLLNHYLTEVTREIRAQDGVVDKYVGDGVVAFFAPPFSRGDAHAADACRSALAQQQAVRRMQADLPELTGLRRDVPPLVVRMGLATGEVVMGSIGSPVSRAFTVIGDAVNLASRLEDLCRVYRVEVLIAEPTYRLAATAVEARELDVVRVPGRDEPVRVYELLGERDRVDPGVRAVRDAYEEGLAAYRGREWERAQAAFARALEIAPTDGPARVLFARVQRFAADPPAADWDGVFTIAGKGVAVPLAAVAGAAG